MAKGSACLSCGEHKWHKKGAVLICASCNAVGWIADPKGVGSGRGKDCPSCSTKTLKTIHDQDGLQIQYCTTCRGVAIHRSSD